MLYHDCNARQRRRRYPLDSPDPPRKSPPSLRP
jgi:hypothetical protein